MALKSDEESDHSQRKVETQAALDTQLDTVKLFVTTQASPSFHQCKLKVCNSHGAEAPRLYAHEPNGGNGYKMLILLSAMAVAKHNGMNFGGLIQTWEGMSLSKTGHGQNFTDVVAEFLGADYLDMFVPEEAANPAWDKVYDVQFSKEDVDHRPAEGNVLRDFGDWNPGKIITLEPEFIEEVRQVQLQQPFARTSQKPLVVMHIRRGDEPMTVARVAKTPNEYYYRLAEQIKRDMPLADIHIFSALEGKYDKSSFDGFTKKGMTVHLDEVGPAEAWSWFAHADVFVMAPSRFSEVGAVFNRGCVVGFDFGTEAPTMYSALGKPPTKGPAFQGDLSKCITSLSLAKTVTINLMNGTHH